MISSQNTFFSHGPPKKKEKKERIKKIAKKKGGIQKETLLNVRSLPGGLSMRAAHLVL